MQKSKSHPYHQKPEVKARKRENNKLWVALNPERRREIARNSYHRRKKKTPSE